MDPDRNVGVANDVFGLNEKVGAFGDRRRYEEPDAEAGRKKRNKLVDIDAEQG
jgi:hypothetical protein